MASNTQIVAELSSYYADDCAAGLAAAQSELDKLRDDVGSDRLIFSAIEGNSFRWAEEGRDPADWFVIWSGVKKRMQDCVDGKTASSGGSVFSAKFNHISL